MAMAPYEFHQIIGVTESVAAAAATASQW